MSRLFFFNISYFNTIVTALNWTGMLILASFIIKLRNITYSWDETLALIKSIKIIDLIILVGLIILQVFFFNDLEFMNIYKVTLLFAVISSIANSEGMAKLSDEDID